MASSNCGTGTPSLPSLENHPTSVIPAKAGIHSERLPTPAVDELDSRPSTSSGQAFRGNDRYRNGNDPRLKSGPPDGIRASAGRGFNLASKKQVLPGKREITHGPHRTVWALPRRLGEGSCRL